MYMREVYDDQTNLVVYSGTLNECIAFLNGISESSDHYGHLWLAD